MRTSVLQGRPKVPASAVTEQRRLPWQICITVSVAYETRQAAKGMLSVRVVWTAQQQPLCVALTWRATLLAIDQHIARGAATLATTLDTLPLGVAKGGAVDGDAGVGIAHQRHVVVLAGHLAAEFVCQRAAATVGGGTCKK